MTNKFFQLGLSKREGKGRGEKEWRGEGRGEEGKGEKEWGGEGRGGEGEIFSDRCIPRRITL